MPLYRQVSRVALISVGVSKTPEMAAVESELDQLRLGLVDERQVFRIVVLRPVSHHSSELKPRRVGGGQRLASSDGNRGESERNADSSKHVMWPLSEASRRRPEETRQSLLMGSGWRA